MKMIILIVRIGCRSLMMSFRMSVIVKLASKQFGKGGWNEKDISVENGP